MKTCRMKKIFIALALILMGSFGAKAQINPSLYVGWGNYTNIGGTLGIGTELRYKSFSVNAAVGMSSFRGVFEGLEVVGNCPHWGFDVGAKYYVYKGLFAGVNYGVLGKYRYMETQYRVRVRNLYGFSFTVGYKWHFHKGIYGMVYTGTTSSKKANNWLGDFGGVEPRFGIQLGYDFKH